MDPLSQAQRSYLMSRVRSKDTSPEMSVRRLVHALGFRYRLHCRNLPGTPDLVFPKKKKVIFVHGCFWHKHNCKHGQIASKSNVDYWSAKLERNRSRDKDNVKALQTMGWQSLIVWECQLKEIDKLKRRLIKFLNS